MEAKYENAFNPRLPHFRDEPRVHKYLVMRGSVSVKTRNIAVVTIPLFTAVHDKTKADKCHRPPGIRQNTPFTTSESQPMWA